MEQEAEERWDDGPLYERYMGRWSRPMAAAFLNWLDAPPGGRWLDVGCGTGALSQAICDRRSPQMLLGIDPSEGFVAYARRGTEGEAAHFCVATAEALPAAESAFGVVVSGLALNFMPSAEAALAEMRRVAAPGAPVALYVWDYAGGMEPLRLFWQVAVALNPAASGNEQGNRFPICRPDALRHSFQSVGFSHVLVEPLDIQVHFANMDAYWQPFAEGGPFPAPAYLKTRPEDERAAIRAHLIDRLPLQPDGAFTLGLRAWAVRATR